MVIAAKLRQSTARAFAVPTAWLVQDAIGAAANSPERFGGATRFACLA